jgi:hypothetical protein
MGGITYLYPHSSKRSRRCLLTVSTLAARGGKRSSDPSGKSHLSIFIDFSPNHLMKYKRDVPTIILKKPIILICLSSKCAKLSATLLHLLG